MMRNEGYIFRGHVPPDDDGLTLLAHLGARWPHSDEDTWRARIAAGEIRVDGRRGSADERVRRHQSVHWHRPPWDEPDATTDFEVLHDDDDVLAVAKPAGLPTLPGAGFLVNTLVVQVRYACPAAAPVHRLGRWTSGVVLFGKTPRARVHLARQMRGRVARKGYLALCSGAPRDESFLAREAIGPVPYPPLGSVHGAVETGRHAESRFRVLERRTGEFVARVTIRTGRPHQIRIHAAAAGHPLSGDPLYAAGGRPPEGCTALPGDPGYTLHAERIRLDHPATDRAFEVSCAPPPVLLVSDAARSGPDGASVRA